MPKLRTALFAFHTLLLQQAALRTGMGKARLIASLWGTSNVFYDRQAHETSTPPSAPRDPPRSRAKLTHPPAVIGEISNIQSKSEATRQITIEEASAPPFVNRQLAKAGMNATSNPMSR